MMENQHNKYDELIVRYLTEEINHQDRATLENWLHESPENQQYFNEFEKIWHLEPEHTDVEIDTSAAWQKVHHHIHGKGRESKTKLRPLYYISGIAATLLILISLYFFVEQNEKPELITYLAHSKTESPLVLPDDSRVFLNAGSEIIYPESFTGTSRATIVTGEAFFEVAHKSEQPFEVDLGEIKVVVMGTSFYIKNIAGSSQITISVISGMVGVYTAQKPENRLTLEASEQAAYDLKSKRFTKSKLTNLNFLAWKTGVLDFDQTPLNDALHDIAATYNLELNIQRDIADLTITARFNREKIVDIFETLSMLFHLDIEQNGREIIIR